MAENKKAYPALYPSEKQDLDMQERLIDQAWDPKTLEAGCIEYNKSYDNLVENWGLDKTFQEEGINKAPAMLKCYFKDLDYDFLISKKPGSKVLPVEDWDVYESKMTQVQTIVEEMEAVFKETADTPDLQRLLVARQDGAKAELKKWLKRAHHLDDGPRTFSGLPFDSEMMARIFSDIRHERLKGKQDWLDMSDKQREKLFESIADETWATMYEKIVKQTQPDRTEAEFNDLKDMYFSVLHPGDISVSNIKDLSKVLFLSAYWSGGSKGVFEVEEHIQQFVDQVENTPPDVIELWKHACRIDPNLKIKGEIGAFVKAIETGFIPKLISEIRVAHATCHYHRACHRVLTQVHEDDYKQRMVWYDQELLVLPTVEEARQNLREQVVEFTDLVDDVIFKQETIRKELEQLKVEQAQKLDMQLPSTDLMISEVVKEALWSSPNDPREAEIEAFVQKFTQYLKSGGDVVALESEAKSLLPKPSVGPENPIEIVDLSLAFNTYVRGQRQRPDLWSLRELLWAKVDKHEGKVQEKRTQLMRHMGGYNDSLVRLMKHVMETSQLRIMFFILEDYSKLVKRFKGEVYGSFKSATEISDAEFNKIVAALEKQNAGKKFFLSREVDPNLVAGFIVQSGANILDYSLQAEQTTLRNRL